MAKKLKSTLYDPLASSKTSSETLIKWYLEEHAPNDPFDTSKAELAAGTIAAYGLSISSQLVESGVIPLDGDLEIEILGSHRSPLVDIDGTPYG